MKFKESKKYPSVGEIRPDRHVRIVREIFSSITREYDFLNHLLSLRRDVAWRRAAARRMRLSGTQRLLDLATGTADLAVEAARRHPGIRVTGVDLVFEMLRAGREKVERNELSDSIDFLQGDALRLPFRDSSFDAVSIAFGIRNIPDRLSALREMRRVVRTGGQVMILEMTLPKEGSFLRSVYGIYLRRVLPLLTRPFSRHTEAYSYLADSITLFPSPPKLAAMMEEAGLRKIEQYPLTFGVTNLHVGYK